MFPRLPAPVQRDTCISLGFLFFLSVCQLLFLVLYLTFASSVLSLTASSLQHESSQSRCFSAYAGFPLPSAETSPITLAMLDPSSFFPRALAAVCLSCTAVLFPDFSPLSNQHTSFFFTPFSQSCSGIFPPCSSIWLLCGAERISSNINAWAFSPLEVASSCSLPLSPSHRPTCVLMSREVCDLTGWDIGHHRVYLCFTGDPALCLPCLVSSFLRSVFDQWQF